MFLAIDVGNTQTTLGLYDDEGTGLVGWRLATDASDTSDMLHASLYSYFTKDGLSLDDVDDAGVACVVPVLTRAWSKCLEGILGHEPCIIAGGPDCGIEVNLPDPSQVGADRTANAVAAVNGDFFRIAAAAEKRADRVADLPSADSLFADGFHDAGDFQPHPFRRSGRRRVVSCPLEKIRAVHGGAFDVDENFVVMHHGIGHFDPREALIVVDFDYVHGVFLLFTVKFFTEIFTII